jgi:hypothetical protein
MRNRVIIALVVAVVALGGYLVLLALDKHERETAEKDATRLALAIGRHDASLAPESDEDWVPGIWSLFKRVDSASLVRVGKRMNGGSALRSSGSDYVGDILLHTARGLVLLEMSFDSGPEPDLLYELSPDRIPAGLLDARTLARVESDQRERGTELANDLTISVAGRTGRDPAKPREGNVVTGLPPLAQCVFAAEHDVRKIQACVRRNG